MKFLFMLVSLVLCLNIFGQNPQVQELGKLYMSGELEQTISKANEFLVDDGDNIDYRLILGRALADKGKYQTAILHLEFCVGNDPANSWRKAWALGYLGTCYYMMKEYEQSQEALKACIQLNATKNATLYASNRVGLFGYDDFFKDWKIIESKNIRFHFQNPADLNIDQYIESREDAFTEINNFFRSDLPKKIDFFGWSSREDAKKILSADLGFANPATCIVHSHVQQTAGHEITHVISFFSCTMSRTTGLINEGTSVCFDMSNNNHQKAVSSWLKTNKECINMKDVWLNWNNYPENLSYPLAGLFVKEMIKRYGREVFLAFFPDQTYENALAVFGEDIDIMIEEFENKYNE